MFTVTGHAVAFDEARPYCGPIRRSKSAAISAWLTMAIRNGESPQETRAAAEQMLMADTGTRITLYGGDEVVVCSSIPTE